MMFKRELQSRESCKTDPNVVIPMVADDECGFCEELMVAVVEPLLDGLYRVVLLRNLTVGQLLLLGLECTVQPSLLDQELEDCSERVEGGVNLLAVQLGVRGWCGGRYSEGKRVEQGDQVCQRVERRVCWSGWRQLRSEKVDLVQDRVGLSCSRVGRYRFD